MINSKIMIPAIALLIGGAIVWIAPPADAFTGSGQDIFVSKLAEKLDVSPDEVSSVMEELRAEHQQGMQQAFLDRLNEAVAAGDLTPEQKDLIVQKHEDMMSDNRKDDSWHELAPEERREQMAAKHQELEQWAEQNGIEISYFGQGQGEKPEFAGSRGGGGQGMRLHYSN